jgi:hypothetical protein
VREEPSVGSRCCVVELIDDDVIELVPPKVVEVDLLSKGLDRGEEDIGVERLLRAGVVPESGGSTDPTEGFQRLAQNLLSVGDEEDALGFLTVESA